LKPISIAQGSSCILVAEANRGENLLTLLHRRVCGLLAVLEPNRQQRGCERYRRNSIDSSASGFLP
jgi:hypothetical protein